MEKEITLTISGFKTIEEAEGWCSAYSGGVEQTMSIYAEARPPEGKRYSFPFNEESITTKGNNVHMVLTHPDTYKK